MSNKFLKVGIAGYGIVGQRRHACMEKHPVFRVVAVCDQTFDGSGFLDDDVKCFKSYEDLLNEQLDVLFVCLTNDIAPQVTMAGLRRGLHVFCEKPPGRNVDDIEAVIACEKQHPELKLKYGFNHRYHDSVQDAIQILKAGTLGRVINLKGVYGKSKIITFNQSDWRTRREIAGGGVLLDQGIHLVDLMRLFAGEFSEIHSFVSNDYWEYDVEDNAYALMKTPDNIICMLHSSATQWRHRFHLEINLARGSLILSGILSGSKSYGAETLTIISADPDNDSGDPKEVLTRYNEDPSWEREINEFAESILQNKPITSGSSDDALKTMQLVFKIYFADEKWRDKYMISSS